MRTTIDLPDDLHALARQLAHENGRSMSDVVAALIRSGLRPATATPATPTTRHGVQQLSVGRAITPDDIRALDDDE